MKEKLVQFTVSRSGKGVVVNGQTAEGRAVKITGGQRVDVKIGEPSMLVFPSGEIVPLT